MEARKVDLTITELVRRLNHLPPEVSRTGEVAHIEETETATTITIPASVFAGSDSRSLIEPEGGIHGVKGV